MIDNWIEKEVSIKEIKELINNHVVEVTSPDGWVNVEKYIEKGKKQAWKLTINDKEILSSAFHLYETNCGWVYAKDLNENKHKILCDDDTYKNFNIELTDDLINVVDLKVNKNHRYYTNGVSSHNTNLGKSLIMASLAVDALLKNKNVLYVTCEMSEDKISERMMANLFDVAVDDLKLLTRQKFDQKFDKIRNTVNNKLFIKEYPPRSINVGHIKNLLRELANKKKFLPDIIFIDYIGIMMPILIRKEDNTYTEQKRISEEIRGLAVETGLPVVSAVQTNRKGFGDAEIDLTDISDSIGTAATADVIIGVTQSQEYRSMGKYAWIVLKNRYGINKRKIVVSVDYFKMRVYQDDDDEGQSKGSSITEPPRQPSPSENRKKVDDASSIVANFIDRNKTIGQTIVEFEDDED